ncbi:alpha/beta fold hydrolase [Kordiimonas pumila]|uniref:Alpha/beta fold hydrolase n=1 Tax=Kordiimonas pumila TaxID=2161677 RepID=A0ABV7D1G0_9PROT|nr:alpha/beta hydrolase [Kordiimonas pumila]
MVAIAFEDRVEVFALGHKTNVHVAGSGRPVILLHGSGPGVSAWSNWAGLIGELAENYKVYAPDIAGFGYTELKDGTKYDIKFWVQHLVAVMDALEIEKAVLVGNSFGGALSIAMALSQADRVEKIMLMGTPCGEFQISDGLYAGLTYEPSLENMRKLVENFPYDKGIITDAMVEARYEASIREGAHEAFRKLMPPPEEGRDTIVKGFPQKYLTGIKCEALVVHGREDRVVPPECGRRIFEAIPRAELHMFGQCGHWVQLERSQQFKKLLSDFLAA